MKKLITIMLIVIIIIFLGVFFYLLNNNKDETVNQNTNVNKNTFNETTVKQVSLDQEFIIKENDLVQINDQDLQIEVKKFHRWECPEFVSCSGDQSHIVFELKQKNKTFTDKIYFDTFFVFSYRIDRIEADYKTYAKLKVTKTQAPYSYYGRLNDPAYIVENQKFAINSENFSVKLLKLHNSPCLEGAMCLWAGVGYDLEISKDQQTETKNYLTGSVNAFGYNIEILDTDYESYILLEVSK